MGVLRLLNKSDISTEYVKSKDLLIAPITSSSVSIDTLPSILGRVVNLYDLAKVLKKFKLDFGNTKTISLSNKLDFMIINVGLSGLLLDEVKVLSCYKRMLDLCISNNYSNMVLINCGMNKYINIYSSLYLLLESYCKSYDINIDLIINNSLERINYIH